MEYLFLLWIGIGKILSVSLPFIILLGVLIFIHELGHFLAARFFKVKVEVFSLGFGPKILKYKKGDTLYCLSLLPLGGYVKMFGDNPLEEPPEDEKHQGFLYKKAYEKWLIAFAGPFFNLAFTLFGFFILAQLGVPKLLAQLGDLPEDSMAFEKGFRSGDQILALNGQKTSYYEELDTQIKNKIGETLSFDVKSDKGERKSIDIEIQKNKNKNPLSWDKERGFIEGFTILSQGLKLGVSSDSIAFEKGLRSFDTLLAVGLYSSEYDPALNLDKEKQKSSDKKEETKKQISKNFKKADWETSLKEASSKDLIPLKYWRELKFFPASKKYKLQVERNSEIKTFSFELEKAQTLLDLGLEPSDLYIERVGADTPAEKAGLKRGDHLMAIGDIKLLKWRDLLKKIEKSNGETLEITYKRGSEVKTVSLAPEKIFVEGNMKSQYMLGIVSAGSTVLPPKLSKKHSLFESAVYSGVQTWKWLNIITTGLVRLVTGEFSIRTMGGPIAIGRVAHNSFSKGFSSFLFIMTLISLNLFLLNLLPIPVLDGGHILFFTLEALLGRPISLKKLLVAQNIGLVFILGFMTFALFNDIYNWLNVW